MSEIYAAPQSDPIEVTNPSKVPGPHNYATRMQRFLGALVDALVMIPVMLLVMTLVGGIFGQSVWSEEGLGLVGTVFSTVIGMASYIGIQWTFWSRSSQSIGKIVMKTQIVNLDGTPTDVQTIAFKRYAIMALLSMVPYRIGSLIGLINAVMVFRSEHNCLHDDIAKTRVVRYQPR